MKHAYLIIAHTDFILLRHLIQGLDDARNDIFIHFDKKVPYIPEVTTEWAGLYIINDREDVRWGDISVVRAEYALFAEAAKRDRYAYYHLLSGVDLPLKSQDEIHRFFYENNGKEFIGFSQYDYSLEVERKVGMYHLFTGDFKERAGIVSLFKRTLRYLFIRLQYVLGVRRHQGVTFKKGTQWISVTHDFVKYLLLMRAEVMRIYTHSFCSDEIYKQTLCWNSIFRSRIYSLDDEGEGCMREVGWVDGKIPDWTLTDYEQLRNSKALFARKFSSKYSELVNRILKN